MPLDSTAFRSSQSGEFYPDKGSKALDPPLHVLNLPLPPHPAFGTRPTGRALAAARRICRNYFRTRVEGELVPALREFNPVRAGCWGS